jgi:FtsP/CotA-like multicopper oxidase with cupredoxin domain
LRGRLRGAQAGAFTLIAARNTPFAHAQNSPTEATDYKIRIAPISLEIAPGKVIKTTAYNGTVLGPALRLKEGQPVRIEVTNDSGYPNLVHSHGLMIPSLQDGATEEGSPIIPPGKSLTYSYIPKPSGTRWYHSHAMAMTDLNKSTYSGEFGFLIVEPAAGDPGSYDREVLLAARSASRASALDRGGRLREGPERSEAPRRGDCDPGATAGALASNPLPWWRN